MAMLLEPGMQSLRMGKAVPPTWKVPSGHGSGGGPLPTAPRPQQRRALCKRDTPGPSPFAPPRTRASPPPLPQPSVCRPPRNHPPVCGAEEPPTLLLRWGNQNQLLRPRKPDPANTKPGNSLSKEATARIKPLRVVPPQLPQTTGSPVPTRWRVPAPALDLQKRCFMGTAPAWGPDPQARSPAELPSPCLTQAAFPPPPCSWGTPVSPRCRALPAHGDARRDVPVCRGSNIHGTDTGYSERHLQSKSEGTGAMSRRGATEPAGTSPGGAHGTAPSLTPRHRGRCE